MIQGIKVTDLPEVINLPSDGYTIVVDSSNTTNKISTSSFFRSFSGVKRAYNVGNGVPVFKNLDSNGYLYFNSLSGSEGLSISAGNNVVNIKLSDNSVTSSKLESSITALLTNLSNRIVTLEMELNLLNPSSMIGAVQPFAVSSAPDGWLECNGDVIGTSGLVQGVPAADLQTLRSKLQDQFGAYGTLPDLRGEFIRGWDHNRGVDINRKFGTYQLDSIETIKGNFSVDSASENEDLKGPFYNSARTNSTGRAGSVTRGIQISFDSSRSVKSSTETRSRNLALLFCIRY
jgi:phage-related tail fiber protein